MKFAIRLSFLCLILIAWFHPDAIGRRAARLANSFMTEWRAP